MHNLKVVESNRRVYSEKSDTQSKNNMNFPPKNPEREIDQNPIHYHFFDKHIVKTQIRIGPELVFRVFFIYIYIYLLLFLTDFDHRNDVGF